MVRIKERMKMNNKIDTSTMLDDEDIELIENIQEIKRHFMSFFKNEGLVGKLKEIIKDSSILDFSNSRTEKFIDVKRPVFIMKVDFDKSIKEYPPKKQFETENDYMNYISNIVYEEVIKHFTKFLRDALTNNEEIANYLETNKIFNEFKNKEDLSNFESIIISSIFGMRIDLEKLIVNLEYVN
jgi:hypothetical protein